MITALSVMSVHTIGQQVTKPWDKTGRRVWFTTLAFPTNRDASVTKHNQIYRVIYLLLFPEGKKTHSRYLNDLKSHTRNITLSLATTTETRNQYFIVLVNEVQATIILHNGQLKAPGAGLTTTTYGDECSDLFAVLDELNTDAFPDGRVWLLGLNSNLLENDALSVG